jgi:alpha-tubulin suppressor-like RCC1 family protein
MNRAVLASVLIFGACFSKPGFRDRDAGADDDGAHDVMPDGGPIPPRAAPHIAAGHHHACAIDATTRLYCWGDNTFGQLGETTALQSGMPLVPFAAMPDLWTSVSAGDQHTCGIRNNTLYCWGDNNHQQSGGANAPNVITLQAVAVRVIAGRQSTCAIDTMGRILCFGQIDPNLPELGQITQIGPTQLADWADISLGTTHACALSNLGKAACWGNNDNRQLGDTGPDRSVPAAAVLPISFVQISANERATCGVTATHELKCFGSNATGLLSDQLSGSDPGTATAVTIGTPAIAWTSIALGYDHACGIAGTSVYCYGVSSSGAMGNGFAGHAAPVQITMPAGFGAATEVVAGEGFSCARDAAAKVTCWGANRYGENGDGTIASTSTPYPVNLGLAPTDVVQSVTTGDSHSCALIRPASGATTVKCWGDNRSRQVDGTTTQYFVGAATSQTALSSISAGEQHTCGVTSTGGNIVCWGNNAEKQLASPAGNGTSILDHGMLGIETFAQVSAGSTSTCAVTLPGKDLYCWGTTPGFGAVMVPTMRNNAAHDWSEVAVGSGFGVGKVDTMEMGGFGDGCKFGQAAGSTFTHAFPATVSNALNGPYTIAVAQSQGEHVCVMLPGLVRCWGSNASHQIDSDVTSSCLGPVEAEALTVGMQWAAPAAGVIGAAGAHTCAIVEEVAAQADARRLYCWGYNPGNLGFLESNGGFPRRAASLIVSQFATGPNHICAIGKLSAGQSQEQVYCWGLNRTGEVGNGSRFHETPVLVTIP